MDFSYTSIKHRYVTVMHCGFFGGGSRILKLHVSKTSEFNPCRGSVVWVCSKTLG
jgi:hypothetical protein